MKQRLHLLVSTCLLFLLFTAVDSLEANVYASSEIKEKLSNVQREQREKQVQAKQTEAEIAKVKREVNELNAEIKKLDEEVGQAQKAIREKRLEIKEARARIEKLKAEIAELEKRIEEREALLKERARAMYQAGGTISYLEVILGAKSFGDFLDRVNAITVIATQDKNIIEAHLADQQQLERAKKEVEDELQSLEIHLKELEEMRAKLEQKRAQKDDLVHRLEAKLDALNEELEEIENAAEILRAQEAALKKELAAYEERMRQQQRLSSRSSGGTTYVHDTPPVTDAGFMRPATGRITSYFGPRSSFGGRMHYGIDIGKNGRSGDVPVVAVQDGTVISARYMNGYGNTVMIAHYIDGRLITTLYAHLDSINVSNGQKVSKGQVIGIMGNTGRSFGPHLHFEVHEGGWNAAKSNAVDPLKYIPR